jgi:hypothetical protein
MKKLYSLYLDLWYAVRGYEDRIMDLTEELKDCKKTFRKATKDLIKITEKYEEITGKPPLKPKS